MVRDATLARRHREWLQTLPRRTGKSLSAIASEARIASSTLYRPLKEGDHGTSTLHARTIEAIVAATGVEPPVGIGPPLPQGAGLPGAAGDEAVSYVPSEKDTIGAAIAALVSGQPHMQPYTARTRALELAGILPGDVILLNPEATPLPGDIVLADVREWSGGRRTILRVFELAPPVAILVGRAGNPIPPLVVDNERITVRGVILPHRLRPHDRPA